VNAPQPGIIPLRRSGLDLGDIVAGVITTFRRDWRTVLSLSAIVNGLQFVLFVVIALGALLMALPTLRGLGDNPTDSQIRDAVSSLLGLGLVTVALIVLISAVARTVLGGMVAVVVADGTLGRRIGIGAALSRIRPVAGRLVLQGVVISVLQSIGFLLCLIPGVWLTGVWAVATPALVLERGRVMESLSRSSSLVGGRFWRTLGIRVLAYGISIAVFYAASVPTNIAFSALGSNSSTTTILVVFGIVGLIQFAIGVVTAPISAITDTLLYVDLRIRREGLADSLRATL
jgi:hypothetical protein